MNLAEASDADVIQRCLDGSERAWDTLLARYEKLIYHTAFRAGAASDEVGEIFQVVCVTWFQELPRLRNPERLGAWLVTTTRRACWSHWRSERRHRTGPESIVIDADASAESPEALAAAAYDARAVQSAIQALPDPCRRLLTLLYLQPERPTYAEVAERLRVPVNSIGPMRMRCLEKLHEALKSAGW